MVEQKFENHENFVINDKYDDEEVRELNREDYYDDHSDIFRKKIFKPPYHRRCRVNYHRDPSCDLFIRSQRCRRQQAAAITRSKNSAAGKKTGVHWRYGSSP